MQTVKNAISAALGALPPSMDSERARVMLWAIGLQESRLTARRQMVGSPPKPVGAAAGLWQFERGGGVKGVLSHAATKAHAVALCQERGVTATPQAVWEALQVDDVLAAGFARLLLWSDPSALPAVGDQAAAWALYVRTWRPGKPHHQTWGALYAQAVKQCAI